MYLQRFTIAFLLILYINTSEVIGFSSLEESFRKCDIQMMRTIGKSNSYVWICRNQNKTTSLINGEIDVVDALEVDAPETSVSSIGRMARTAACFYHAVEMDPCLCQCCRAPYQWKITASKIVKDCITNAERKKDARYKFNYSRKYCSAVFATYRPSPSKAVWFCKCVQPRPIIGPSFDVSVGRAEFIPSKMGALGLAEVQFIKRCTRTRFDDLQHVCKNSPEQFEVYALQLMQSCCKQALMEFPGTNMDCAAIVP